MNAVTTRVGRIAPALITLFWASAAHAQAPVAFASFSVSSTGNSFRFINNGSSSLFGTYDASGNLVSIPVNFNYNTGNGYDNGRGSSVGTTIAGMMSLSASVSGMADVEGKFVYQDMQMLGMQISANMPQAGFSNLLTVTPNTSGTLSGRKGGSTAGLAGEDDTPNNTSTGGTVGFTSDFLDFTSHDGTYQQKDFSYSFTSVVPQFTVATNGYVASFTSQGSGVFSSNPTPAEQDHTPPPPPNGVPEPGTILLLISGMGSIAAVARRRSRLHAG